MTRIILHVETVAGQPCWWGDGPEHNYTAAAPTLVQVKDLTREACAMEGWTPPEWELCPCTRFEPCSLEGADDGPAE